MAKVLLVSRYLRVREFIAEELAGRGHVVAAIGDPALIQRVLSTLEPELVLLDFHLNRVHGWEKFKKPRRRTLHPPVFTFSFYNGGQEKIRLKIAKGYRIEKFSLETLRQQVSELLGPNLSMAEGMDGDFLLPRGIKVKDGMLENR